VLVRLLGRGQLQQTDRAAGARHVREPLRIYGIDQDERGRTPSASCLFGCLRMPIRIVAPAKKFAFASVVD
jgi:hypothetical protein